MASATPFFGYCRADAAAVSAMFPAGGGAPNAPGPLRCLQSINRSVLPAAQLIFMPGLYRRVGAGAKIHDRRTADIDGAERTAEASSQAEQ
jgi:hypothetical protein